MTDKSSVIFGNQQAKKTVKAAAKSKAKYVKKYGDEAKVAVRNERRELLEKYKKMKKDSEITEDDQKNGEKKVQTLTDRFTEEIDKLVAAKEKEIMSI